MNQSAHDTLDLARRLGGEAFVEYVSTIHSVAMADLVFPRLMQGDVSPEIARLLDTAFLIGVYEAWRREYPPARGDA